jgi:sodium transport system ATP-binding protein
VLVARAVLQNIIELRERGKTIVFSTHSMHEVEKLCSHVAIIYKGRVQAEGTPRGLLEEFDQPDLEELFFFLVARADLRGKGSGSGEEPEDRGSPARDGRARATTPRP